MLSPDNPVTFSWLVYDRVEGKVRDDWEIFKEIEAKTGVKVEFQIVSQEGLDEKRQIMIATNTATDFIQVPTQDGREHGPEKVFLNLNDYLDRAPNLKAFTRNIRKPKRWQRARTEVCIPYLSWKGMRRARASTLYGMPARTSWISMGYRLRPRWMNFINI